MKPFAFVVNPLTVRQFKIFSPIMRIIKNNPSFKVSKIKKVRSIHGKEIQGYFITSLVLTKQMFKRGEDFILDKLITCGHIAEELGAGILGLGGYIKTIIDREDGIIKNLKIPVTTGNTFTAWSILEAIYRTAKTKNIDLRKSTVAVIDATSPVGSLCSRKLSDYVSKIIITANHREKLELLKETIINLRPIEVVIEEDVHKAVKNVDIVINANASDDNPINIEELKSGTIVCEASESSTIATKLNPRQDIIVIKGGLIRLPFPAKLNAYTGLPKNIIYADMAEVMLLTLAKKFVNYSLGDNVNLDKLEEVADLAVQHGFEVWVPEAPVL